MCRLKKSLGNNKANPVQGNVAEEENPLGNLDQADKCARQEKEYPDGPGIGCRVDVKWV